MNAAEKHVATSSSENAKAKWKKKVERYQNLCETLTGKSEDCAAAYRDIKHT
jgi:hypothetical protein